ncbi:hypothetical protein H072_258 [Dactylellina haptotyla CBS 200.50]|uniref:C2H2-type domain-containing protein n=1 Tax=Dactylellina haptotyla (strain CBS 200.50) TaxID=1284197 RepID=S8AS51_DACHA|nr:hypothetical protein H072_258 [Dactylellina haptotyla CBS 200.50]
MADFCESITWIPDPHLRVLVDLELLTPNLASDETPSPLDHENFAGYESFLDTEAQGVFDWISNSPLDSVEEVPLNLRENYDIEPPVHSGCSSHSSSSHDAVGDPSGAVELLGGVADFPAEFGCSPNPFINNIENETHFVSHDLPSSQGTVIPADYHADNPLPVTSVSLASLNIYVPDFGPDSLENYVPEFFANQGLHDPSGFSNQRCPSETSTSASSFPTESVGSFAHSDDAIASPKFPAFSPPVNFADTFGLEDAPGSPVSLEPSPSPSDVSQTVETSPRTPKDVNRFAREQKENDYKGYRWRQASRSSLKRKRENSEESEEPAPARKPKTEIKRPREAKYICPYDDCPKRFTQERRFQVHFRTHGKPLFICKPCGKALSRQDNYQTHLKSSIHKKKMAAYEAKASTSSTVTTPDFSGESPSPDPPNSP